MEALNTAQHKAAEAMYKIANAAGPARPAGGQPGGAAAGRPRSARRRAT